MKVQTQSVHFDADAKLLEFIDRKLNKLEVFFDRIIDAEVYLRLENSGQVKDKVAEVKINVPGSILIAKDSSKSFEESIDTVANSLKRQLIKHKERSRGSFNRN